MTNKQDDRTIDDIYQDSLEWHVNTGGETIHAKRMGGKWRNIKWLSASVWIIFFIGPFLRYGDRQAVLLDIPNLQFHIFGITVLPQDFWLLSLLLLFFAILLAVGTALAGRVYCGFFCFQTIWTDVFTWLEEKIEGNANKRKRFDKAKWDISKTSKKVLKHSIWIIIGFLTGAAFVSWFVDIYDLWSGLADFPIDSPVVITIFMFTVGTYVLAGFLREQACFWLCPYARIQGVMIDNTSVVPTYDFYRGEKRGKVSKNPKESDKNLGDCIDCKQCIAVCPTGVDIRNGQQEGCIMCGLCIDACDAIMDKVDRPRGLIRYESLDVLSGKEDKPLWKRPRIWLYTVIMSVALIIITVGLSKLDAVELKVLHSRLPLYVMQSDGSIQNKYTLKILNKMTKDLNVKITAKGIDNLTLVGADELVHAKHGKVTAKTVFVKIPPNNLKSANEDITFVIQTSVDGQTFISERKNTFMSPK